MGGKRREEEGLLLSQMHSLGSEILASVSLRCCLKFWHLLGGKGKDLLPLLLGGEGRTENGSETSLGTTNGRADTLSRLSCLILLGSLGVVVVVAF